MEKLTTTQRREFKRLFTGIGFWMWSSIITAVATAFFFVEGSYPLSVVTGIVFCFCLAMAEIRRSDAKRKLEEEVFRKFDTALAELEELHTLHIDNASSRYDLLTKLRVLEMLLESKDLQNQHLTDLIEQMQLTSNAS